MPVAIPAEFLAHAARSTSWSDWLSALPRLVRDVCAEWQLEVTGEAASGACAVVFPVLTATGAPAVVKFGWPHWEAEHEHLALRAWDGDGAVRLLRADPHRFVLLLERASTTDLTGLPVLEACEVISGLYGRLHRPALPQLVRLSTLALRWSQELAAFRASSAVPRRFVEQAAGIAADFGSDPGTDGVLVHSDLHYFNVLASARPDAPGWLAIDPKPLSGDPAYEVAPLLWNRWDDAVGSGDIRAALVDRLFTVVDAAGLDEDRVRDWTTLRMMVNLYWAATGEDGPGLTRDEATIATTIVKAVQR